MLTTIEIVKTKYKCLTLPLCVLQTMGSCSMEVGSGTLLGLVVLRETSWAAG